MLALISKKNLAKLFSARQEHQTINVCNPTTKNFTNTSRNVVYNWMGQTERWKRSNICSRTKRDFFGFLRGGALCRQTHVGTGIGCIWTKNIWPLLTWWSKKDSSKGWEKGNGYTSSTASQQTIQKATLRWKMNTLEHKTTSIRRLQNNTTSPFRTVLCRDALFLQPQVGLTT